MHRTKSRHEILVAKIDLGKAYDRINLDILKSTLKDFGLLTGTVKLIMFCVQFFSVSLLWNGLKLPVFSPTRELRQGDPLSPYLFVMCIEKLACLINKKVFYKTWLSIYVSKGGPSISHQLLRMMSFCLLKLPRRKCLCLLVSHSFLQCFRSKGEF